MTLRSTNISDLAKKNHNAYTQWPETFNRGDNLCTICMVVTCKHKFVLDSWDMKRPELTQNRRVPIMKLWIIIRYMLYVIWSDAMRTGIHTASYSGRRKCSLPPLWKPQIMNSSSQLSGHSFDRSADRMFPELHLCCKRHRRRRRSTGETSRFCQTRGQWVAGIVLL